jgi:DNA-binding NarL/FixJ family response regulator
MATNSKMIRVALADDHTMFRKGIVGLLRSSGKFEVVAEAGNGSELIEMIGALDQHPDVCLLDVNMPVLDGYDTLIALKKKYPLMKFLALTMYDHEFIIIKMLRNGANGYLLKEDDPDELKRAIEYIYHKDFYHSELVSGRLISILKQGVDYNQVLLSSNEQVFLEYCCTELTYKEIAEKMKLSVRTVEGYRDSLFDRLNVKSRTGLVIYALKHGIVNLT